MVNLTGLCEEFASKYHVKNRDLLALFSFFKANFNDKRKGKRLPIFNDEQLCELLYNLGNLGYKDFVELIKTEFTGGYKNRDKMYLAEEYENYNAIAKRYDKTILNTLNFVKKLGNVMNERRKLIEMRELTRQEINSLITVYIMPFYKDTGEFKNGIAKFVKSGKGDLASIVFGVK